MIQDNRKLDLFFGALFLIVGLGGFLAFIYTLLGGLSGSPWPPLTLALFFTPISIVWLYLAGDPKEPEDPPEVNWRWWP